MSTPVYRRNSLRAGNYGMGLGNPFLQSNQRHWEDSDGPCGLKTQIRTTGIDWLHGLDSSDRPPEPVAQVRVLRRRTNSTGRWSCRMSGKGRYDHCFGARIVIDDDAFKVEAG